MANLYLVMVSYHHRWNNIEMLVKSTRFYPYFDRKYIKVSQSRDNKFLYFTSISYVPAMMVAS